MIYVRRRGLLIGGIIAWLAVVLLDHGPAWRDRAAHASGDGAAVQVNVTAETSLKGHNSIAIDEASLGAPGSPRFLHFSTLGQWDYDRHSAPPCPEPIRQLGGQTLSSVGFMYPLESGEKVKSFCLLRSTQTCCYGPRPQFNQYILIESRTPVPF